MVEVEFDESTLPFEERWENLTLANDFMFGHVMQKKSLCIEMMRRILPDMKIKDIRIIDIQKTFRGGLDTRGVRFDMYVESENRNVFDVEIQTSKKADIARRTRAYHAMMGGDILNKYKTKGRTYSDIPDSFVIFICTFDPFRLGRHVYTFKNFCCEDKSLPLNDGGTTIFLNAYGKDEVNPKMKAFLDFIIGRECDDLFVKELSGELDIARHNAKWRGEYMKSVMERNETFAKGKAEGVVEEKFDTVRRLRMNGIDERVIHLATDMPIEEIRRLYV
ncbi:MAG: Rpn family recombination-promoting nuclease/putative transposase [Synergistaceae bacterium]|nr:Rpn family recombination-promoting nuclease/putative transposase [Synergistaceae bacterium]